MVLVVAFLVEAFSTKFADERFVARVDPRVRVESGRAIKGLSAR